eukprot:TRINITY_DN2719_c0_g1_i1.p1 TRINITY_DN2719_c0_g1~~TRINITY_DN2719_c0_g1_i1.p1  ORF type:complete len:343 (-),score=84.77 TRINITY_DN2719_c0_g1_i1:100-1128(-)
MRSVLFFLAILMALLAAFAYIVSQNDNSIFNEAYSKDGMTLNVSSDVLEDQYFKTSTDFYLFKQEVLSDVTNVIVFVFHGFGEHSSKDNYKMLTSHMKEKGASIFLYDHRGHGRSSGDRGHIVEFSDFVEDGIEFVEYILNTYYKEERESKTLPPIIFFGHSMGSIIASQIGLAFKEMDSDFNIDGMIICSTGIDVDNKIITPVTRFIINIISSIAPKFPIDELKSDIIVKDQTERQKLIDDELNLPVFKARFAQEFLDTCDELVEDLVKFDFPVLVIHGSDDKVANVRGAKLIYDKISTNEDSKRLVIVEGAYHEMFLEPVVMDEFYIHINDFFDFIINKI